MQTSKFWVFVKKGLKKLKILAWEDVCTPKGRIRHSSNESSEWGPARQNRLERLCIDWIVLGARQSTGITTRTDRVLIYYNYRIESKEPKKLEEERQVLEQTAEEADWACYIEKRQSYDHHLQKEKGHILRPVSSARVIIDRPTEAMTMHLKPLYIKVHIEGVPVSGVLVDGGLNEPLFARLSR